MLTYLHRLPDLAILALTVFVITGVAMAAPLARRRLFKLDVVPEHSGAAIDGYKAVLSMLGVVLAFSLVQANNILHEVDGLVGKEAAAVSSVDRVLLRIGKPELAALRPALAHYARVLIDDEWPRLKTGLRSYAADDAFQVVSKAAREAGPSDARQQTMYNELVRNLDDLSDLREQILAAADAGLPSFFWITIAGLLALAFLLAAFAKDDVAGLVAVAAPGTAVALLLAFLFIVDLPFEGETSVKPTAIEKALLVDARRQ